VSIPKRIRDLLKKIADALGIGNGESEPFPSPLKAPVDALKGMFDTPIHAISSVVDVVGKTVRRLGVVVRWELLGQATKRQLERVRSLFKLGKRLGIVAQLSALFDIVTVFRQNRVGSATFYQNYGLAGLGILGAIAGGSVFELWFGVWACSALAGLGLGVVAPPVFVAIVAGVAGATLFQLAGSLLYQQTAPGSFLYRSYAGSFVNRAATRFVSFVRGIGFWMSSVRTGTSQGVSPDPSERTSNRKAPLQGKRYELPKLRDRNRILPPPQWSVWPWFFWPEFLPAGITDGPPPTWPSPGVVGNRGGRPRPRGGAAGQSRAVGGVLFENCAAVLTGITEITGGYWDENSRSLVLIGKDSPDGKEFQTTLPQMDAENLKVAMRSAILGEGVGVSIDPPAKYRSMNGLHKMPPDGTPMIVSYLGGCEMTLAGAICFEADRLMKSLSIGMDNRTRKPFRASVPGFRDTFQRYSFSRCSGSTLHRFWFEIDRVELIRSAQSGAFTFGEVKIKLLTQMPGEPLGRDIDPVDAEFARHMSEHYDDYSKEFPIFARLKELAKASAIAQFLVNENVSIDLGEILDLTPMAGVTPDTTPSIVRSEITRSGNAIRTSLMSGGVALRCAANLNFLVKEDVSRKAALLRQYASTARPPAVDQWHFREGLTSSKARAVSLGAIRSSRLIKTDHEFLDIHGSPTLSIQRVYESNRISQGVFGPGWHLFVPWSMKVLRPSGKRPEVLTSEGAPLPNVPHPVLALRDGSTGRTRLYRNTSDGKVGTVPCWALVEAQSITKNGLSFEYNSFETIRIQDGRFVMDRGGRSFWFDASGRLVETFRRGKTRQRYIWEKEHLIAIENEDGQSYSISYNDETGMIDCVHVSDGKNFDFSYDESSCLREVRLDTKCIALYGYDLSCRLAEVCNGEGTVSDRIVHHTGSKHRGTSFIDTIAVCSEGRIEREFRFNRIVSATDDHGTRADVRYNPQGTISKLVITTYNGDKWKLEYNANRRLRRFVDPLGRITEFVCDQKNRITGVTLPDRLTGTAVRGAKSTIKKTTGPFANYWKPICRSDGRVPFGALYRSSIQWSVTDHTLMDLAQVGQSTAESCGNAPVLEFPTSYRSTTLAPPTVADELRHSYTRGKHVRRMVSPDGQSFDINGPAGIVRTKIEKSSNVQVVVSFL